MRQLEFLILRLEFFALKLRNSWRSNPEAVVGEVVGVQTSFIPGSFSFSTCTFTSLLFYFLLFLTMLDHFFIHAASEGTSSAPMDTEENADNAALVTVLESPSDSSFEVVPRQVYCNSVRIV